MPYFSDYQVGKFYDELFVQNSIPRPVVKPLINQINALPPENLRQRQKAAEELLLQLGITFNVYGNTEKEERIFPFDIIPRIIEYHDWLHLESGIKQRVLALNHFLRDIYGDQEVIAAGIIPRELITSSEGFRPICREFRPPKDIWVHVTGTDLVRDSDGELYVLEDNVRCPSGVSYALENRAVIKHTFADAFARMGVMPINEYPERLLHCLRHLARNQDRQPKVVVLTPGPYNSAYFEHSFLAREMGANLVEGRDLIVEDSVVKMKTTHGFEDVDVIYRRIDDDFVDPKVFRKDSLLGVPGLMEAYRHGNVAIANAVGTGIADDKAIYAYIPEIIKFYLGEEAIIPNVPTFVCWQKDQRDYVIAHLDQLVVKAVNLSGGYGILIGPQATVEERESFRRAILKNPRSYIAQPTLSLSRVPTLIGEEIEGRHVDFRPYALFEKEVNVIPGGLTRVALKKGSLVVNSSQGGGSKDTWVLADPRTRLN